MQSGSSPARLIPSRERKHNRCTSLVPLGFLREIFLQLREEFLARILTTRDYDVIHVDSDHQRHLILGHQPKNIRLCFALFETNLFYLPVNQQHMPLSTGLLETVLTLLKPHDFSGELTTTRGKTHRNLFYRGSCTNARDTSIWYTGKPFSLATAAIILTGAAAGVGEVVSL